MTRRVEELGCHLLTSRHPVEELLRYAVELDGLGFDHLKVGDHTLVTDATAQYPNAHVVLAAMGALTKRVKLSTAVTDPYRRHPVEIAQWVATLDRLTGGRAALGIGSGEVMNLAPYGIDMVKPFTRLREAVEVIKMLWGATPGAPAQFSGEVFNLRGAYLQVKPITQPRPPIYIGAIRQKARELAARVADGWIAMAAETPETLREKTATLGSPEGFNVVVTLYTDITESLDAAYKSVEGAAKGALVWERELVGRKAGVEVPEELSVQMMDVRDGSVVKSMKEMMERIPHSLVEETTLAATSAEECIGKIEKFLDAGATSIVICNLSQRPETVFREYGAKVFPYLRENYGTRGRR